MGMTEKEYYSMSPRNFFLKAEGYENKVYRERSDLRKVAFAVLKPHFPKVDFERFKADFWPLTGDEKLPKDEKIDTPDLPYWDKVKSMQSKRKKRK